MTWKVRASERNTLFPPAPWHPAFIPPLLLVTVALIKSSAAVTADPKLPIFSPHYDKGAKRLSGGAAAHNTTHERPDTAATRPDRGGGRVSELIPGPSAGLRVTGGVTTCAAPSCRVTLPMFPERRLEWQCESRPYTRPRYRHLTAKI